MNPCLFCKWYRMHDSNTRQRCKKGHPLEANCPDYFFEWRELRFKEQRKGWGITTVPKLNSRTKSIRPLNRGVVFGQ